MSRNPIPPRVPPKGTVPPKPATPRSMATAAPVTPVDAPAPIPENEVVQSQEEVTSHSDVAATSGPIIARAASYYRTTRYIMVALLLAWEGGSAMTDSKDGRRKMPALRRSTNRSTPPKRPTDTDTAAKLNDNPLSHKTLHTDTDILIQKLLAFGLPIGSAAMLFWALYNSRGEYRLAGNVLSAPGHRAVRLEDISSLDKKLWDRKGIAYVTYTGASGNGVVRLDDFIYEREPIDQIYDQITAYLAGETATWVS